MRIAILDEDPELGRQMAGYLKEHNMEALLASDPQAFRSALSAVPDVAVLGLDLADGDGYGLLTETRRKDENLPILVVSRRGDLPDRLLGFQLGADDFLSRPLEQRELLARVRALARRNRSTGQQRRRHGALTLDLGRRAAFLKGKDLELTANEFEGLWVLAAHAGRALTRPELKERLNGLGQAAVEGRGLDIMVSRLRSRLGDDARSPRYIKTLHGVGYMFLPQDTD